MRSRPHQCGLGDNWLRIKPAPAPDRKKDMTAKALWALVFAAALALTTITAYHLGKDCGAWEAKRRLDGAGRPALCFAVSRSGRLKP